ncbi:Exodeoxyribonuclease 7 large subunit [BD1-7 clade bacterium]|uniref:Exodeoxyribonuclease 7 large subunit n=1 Tax=BD1-7 clade bacterium TaxID=2029982 RepID=A0A5S9QD72_9GAMM|nr:Exodeoxyribonuclease 7 large subunit [BD1-7 clade bacterium]CAA0116300.1 Exodeoxyribonuclease 7 large subunit [BD1-7 clade bacterium]
MNRTVNPQQPVLSVSELNQYAKGVLEMHVGKIAVQGEISNFSRPASGHWYFTLKDSQAQIRCAMFRNKNQFIRTQAGNGMEVILHGSVSLYPNRGDYQLIVDYMEESGLGALQRRFEQLKQKLQHEGLFNQQNKKPLPRQARHIAVITSATGAAIRDILSVLQARFPALRVTLIPTSVQGEQSVGEIVTAIDRANQWQQSHPDDPFDAVIIGRGGGSLEDLWSFNEESVVRAIYTCDIPVISAVGHETDVTLSDLVADVRAPTPSAAAEMISPDKQQLAQQLDFLERQLLQLTTAHIGTLRHNLLKKRQQLIHPGERILGFRAAFAEKQTQLEHLQRQQILQQRLNLQTTRNQLNEHQPKHKLESKRQQVSNLLKRLQQASQSNVATTKNRLAQQTNLLDAVSPLATLKRGYAIVENDQDQVIRTYTQVTTGDCIKARLAHGEIHCKVIATETTAPKT